MRFGTRILLFGPSAAPSQLLETCEFVLRALLIHFGGTEDSPLPRVYLDRVQQSRTECVPKLENENGTRIFRSCAGRTLRDWGVHETEYFCEHPSHSEEAFSSRYYVAGSSRSLAHSECGRVSYVRPMNGAIEQPDRPVR